MFAWWTSIDAVNRFNGIVQWVLAISAGFTFVALILAALGARQFGILQNREAEQLRAQVAEANRKAAEANQRAAEANQKAE